MASTAAEVGATRFCQLFEAVRRLLDGLSLPSEAYTPPAWVRDAVGFGVYAGPYTVNRDDPLGLHHAHVPLDGYAAIPDAATRIEHAARLLAVHGAEELEFSEPLAFIDLVLAGTHALEPRAADVPRTIAPEQADGIKKLTLILDQDWQDLQDTSPLFEQLAGLLPRLVDAMAREQHVRIVANEMVKARVQRLFRLLSLSKLYFDHRTSASLTTALYSLRFLRNMVVAGEDQLQQRMQHRVLRLFLVKFQSSVIRLTSGAIVESEDEVPLARAFVQLLANCTTRCEEAQDTFWGLVFADNTDNKSGPGLLQRLIEMNDGKVAVAVRILLLNCVLATTEGGDTRAEFLAQAAPARPVVRMLLHGSHRTLESLLSAEEQEASPGSADGEEILQLDHAVLKTLFRRGLLGSVLSWLGTELSTELVALLKFFDAYLDAGMVGYGAPLPPPPDGNVGATHDASTLWGVWRGLSAKMQDLLLHPPEAGQTEKKSEIVALHQALVLILQILCAFIYPAQQGGEPCSDENETVRVMGCWFVRQFSAPEMVEDLIALLAAISKFSPPISPFTGTGARTDTLPEGHALSHTGRSAQTQSPQSVVDLPYLKRDLLRLITGLTFLPPRVSVSESHRVADIQDRVHRAGGLWVVLGLTQVDVANPYIREHAILALSALLKHNLTNQDAVAQLQPQEVDQDKAWDSARQQALQRSRD